MGLQNGLDLLVQQPRNAVPDWEGLFHDHVCGALFNPTGCYSGALYSHWAPLVVTHDSR